MPSSTTHLIVPFACCLNAGCTAALATLRLPHLQALLARLAPSEATLLNGTADAHNKTPPHERVQAQALGMPAPDGQIAWAALNALRLGLSQRAGDEAWATVTPCHWHVAADHITMNAVDLQEAESQALCAAIAPWFVQDGIELHYADPAKPTQWLARGEVFRGLPTASLDRVLGRNIDAWMPEGAQAAPLRRLQNEMQMLLYHHAVNDARAQRGAPPVNSFWISGTGALPAGFEDAPPLGVRVSDALRASALAEDWAAWAQAWQALDATECKALMAAMNAGETVQLTLCGERAAQSFGPVRRSPWSRIFNVLGGMSAPALLGVL